MQRLRGSKPSVSKEHQECKETRVDHEGRGLDEYSDRETTWGSVGNGSIWPSMLSVTGSRWSILSREMMDTFGFYRITPPLVNRPARSQYSSLGEMIKAWA